MVRPSPDFREFSHFPAFFFAVKWRIFCTSCLIVANFLNALTRHLASASVRVFLLDGNSEHVSQVWRKRDLSENKFSAAVDRNKCLKPIKLLILFNTCATISEIPSDINTSLPVLCCKNVGKGNLLGINEDWKRVRYICAARRGGGSTGHVFYIYIFKKLLCFEIKWDKKTKWSSCAPWIPGRKPVTPLE